MGSVIFHNHVFPDVFRPIFLVVIFWISLGGCARPDGISVADFPRSAEPVAGIAFVREEDGDRNIYLIQPDGSGLQRLIGSDAADSDPAFSPDGRTLAFRSRRDGSSDLYLAAADGSGAWFNLVNDPSESVNDEFNPRWHPSGALLALYTDRFQPPIGSCTGNRGVHHLGFLDLLQAPLRIEHFDDLAGHQGSFAWSPDGRRLAISSACRSTNAAIHLWDRETGEVRQLTDEAAYNAIEPAFSPDGQVLAFAAFQDEGADILLYHLVTGEMTNLTASPTRDFQPTWSPDGQWIAFTSSEAGNNDIFVIRRDGTGRRNITSWPGPDLMPDWSPIGGLVQ